MSLAAPDRDDPVSIQVREVRHLAELVTVPSPRKRGEGMKAFQQIRLGEGEAAAPHPTVLAERLSLPSPRLRGEGAITAA
jgi:hypothetical protein